MWLKQHPTDANTAEKHTIHLQYLPTMEDKMILRSEKMDISPYELLLTVPTPLQHAKSSLLHKQETGLTTYLSWGALHSDCNCLPVVDKNRRVKTSHR